MIAVILSEVFGPDSPLASEREPFWSEEHSAADRAWLWRVPCARGHLYQHGLALVGFSGVGMPLRSALLRIPGVKSHQTGDEEFAVTFPVAALADVCALVKPAYLPGRNRRSLAKLARKCPR